MTEDFENKIKELIEKLRYGLIVCEATGTSLIHIDRADAKTILDTLILALKEQEPHEITKDEWESWKKAKNRDPLCMYWRGDITPFWILRPEQVHEPAYLIGDIKIFKGKPNKEKMHRMWLK